VGSDDGPTVLGVERVYNPHTLPIFDALRSHAGLRFTGCVLEPLKPWRVQLGWPELAPDAPHLQPWRSAADCRRYRELVRAADIVIWPGLKFRRSVRLILGRLRRGQLNVVWAERFREKRERRWYETLSMKAVVRLLNSPRVHLMALGEGAAEDYRAYGATRWKAWRFGYAVTPVKPLVRSPTPAPDGRLRLLYVGALRSKKGVDVLLRALGSSELVGGRWRLKIVGDGKERAELQALAAALGIAGQVEFAGVVRHDRIGAVYCDSDVLILPSRYEGWGAVVNEAMEHALAVVVSDGAGCARMLIDHGRTGFVFPRGDVESLAGYLKRLIAQPAEAATFGLAGRARIAAFRPDVIADRAARLFRGLTGHDPLPEFADGFCAAVRG